MTPASTPDHPTYLQLHIALRRLQPHMALVVHGLPLTKLSSGPHCHLGKGFLLICYFISFRLASKTFRSPYYIFFTVDLIPHQISHPHRLRLCPSPFTLVVERSSLSLNRTLSDRLDHRLTRNLHRPAQAASFGSRHPQPPADWAHLGFHHWFRRICAVYWMIFVLSQFPSP
jgi:hypothetical protein